MDPQSLAFRENSISALSDKELQSALSDIRGGWVEGRSRAAKAFPDFEDLRDRGRDIRDHALANLAALLEQFEANVMRSGGRVHWARNADEARVIVERICTKDVAKIVTKSKSMVAEEIQLNDHLQYRGITPVETDLGEYIIQIAGDRPSHLVGPAIHMTKGQVSDLFARHHGTARKEDGAALVEEARELLRARYREADIGITGANFLIADTGSIITVTNEGNAELTQGLPKRHIVVTGIEKVVPSMAEAFVLLRLLARSATGQEFSSYTTVLNGPRRTNDSDGPSEFDVILVDNGRSDMIAGKYREMLRCIRCGACMNHCPVYLAAGGHAYGWVYVGPMGSVLTPNIVGLKSAHTLPNASTFCGKCEEVCPVRIPLPGLMRKLREDQHRQQLDAPISRRVLALWGAVASRPSIYRTLFDFSNVLLRAFGRGKGSLKSLPFAGNWTVSKDLPLPQGATFSVQWKNRKTADS